MFIDLVAFASLARGCRPCCVLSLDCVDFITEIIDYGDTVA